MRRSCSLRREFLPATRLKRARKSFLHAGPFFETGYRACVPDRGVGEQVSAMSSSRKLEFRLRCSGRSVDKAAHTRAQCAYTSFCSSGTKGAQRVDEWHDFFLAAAGAAAVLAGLVLVGVSINLEMIM